MKVDEKVEIADVGCGYGGLLISLSDHFKSKYIVGFEIRTKVTEYVEKRINALRIQNEATNGYQNVGVLRSNAMKYLPNFFEKGQLSMMFFLFPDPHFKKKKQKARIINYSLLAEYAFVLKVGGYLWVATDVPDLFDWMVLHLDKFPLFKKIESEENYEPAISHMILNRTEESHKVDREGRDKYFAVYKRIEVE